MTDSARIPPSSPLDVWLAELAEAKGAPGGGAACGVLLAMSAALLKMVAGYSGDDPRVVGCSSRVEALRTRAVEAATADGIHSASFGEALALDDDDPRRDERVADAALTAGRSSAVLGDIAKELAAELALLRKLGNPNVRADLVVAAEALAAGIRGASANLVADQGIVRAHDGDEGALTELEDARVVLAQTAARVQDIADAEREQL